MSIADKLAQFVRKSAELLNIVRPPYVYHMDCIDERNAMIDTLWTGEYASALGRFSSAHPGLITLFEAHRAWTMTERHGSTPSPGRCHGSRRH